MTGLPPGWRCELLGLINAVQFTNPADDRGLLWCDGEWTMTIRGVTCRASLAAASDQREARKIGTSFLWEVNDDVA